MPYFALPRRSLLCMLLLVVPLVVLTGCGSGYKDFPPGTVLSVSATTVWLYPLVTEDLSGPCMYDLRLPSSSEAVAGTLVVFQRGDTENLYNDATVQSTMDTLHFAMVFAHECDARTTGSFQADASQGPARVLFAALDALASSSGHAELSTGNVVLFGYSAAGVLTATLLNEQPDRILGAVEYIPGDVHVNIATVPVSTGAQQIPALVLANADDEQSGTTRVRAYFSAGYAAGAPWAFGVQHATDHCCSLSTRSVILPWITSVASATQKPMPRRASVFASPVYTTLTCTPDTTLDVFGDTNCAISAASIQAVPGKGSDGWLPNAASGAAWLQWVLNPVTNH